MNTFKVTFPAHFSADHHRAYLDELLDFADWHEVESGIYMLVPFRKNTVDYVRADLRRQQDLRRLSFEEITD